MPRALARIEKPQPAEDAFTGEFVKVPMGDAAIHELLGSASSRRDETHPVRDQNCHSDDDTEGKASQSEKLTLPSLSGAVAKEVSALVTVPFTPKAFRKTVNQSTKAAKCTKLTPTLKIRAP